ncbi:MAG TPA: LysM peptidoglycan-binding domain-containing protein, partial [Lacunisphaera sp.]|nr:LysM peptidoglycan-binding domain-containing protein [Lacunisphaera sp.]
TAADQARTALTKEFEDYRGSTAAAQRERTTLLANVRMLESEKAALRRQVETADSETTQLRAQFASLKEQAPAKPAYPDLSGKVTELQGQLAAASAEAGRAKQEIAALTKAAETAKAAAPAYPDLSDKVAALNDELTQLRADRERMQKMLADSGRQLRDATASANRVKELENQLAGLTAETERAQAQATALTRARETAESRVAELQAALSAKPAYPDLSGRVKDLEEKLAEAESRRRGPVYPNLASRVAELEGALAAAKRDLTDAESRLAQAASQPAPAVSESAPAAETDTSEIEKRLAETEGKLTTALRGYALLQKDRDALEERLTRSDQALNAEKNQLAEQVATLTAELNQTRATVAGQTEAVAASTTLATEKDALNARLAEAESRASQAQAEAARLAEALGALQRSSGQGSTEVAAARTLVQQLQGANAVLAQENYQLKAMVSRTAGAPAPAAVRSAPTAPTAPTAAPAAPAPRTHVVASGDSLSRISQRYYGTANRWQEIYNANTDRIAPNGILRIGVELRIP